MDLAFSAEQEFSPFELGLGRLVNLDKGRFVGRKALRAEQAAGGPARRLAGIEFDWAGIEAAFEKHGLPTVLYLGTSESSIPVYRGGRQVGRATTTTWSPVLKKLIALATIEAPYAADGTPLDFEITVEAVRHRVPAVVVRTPFFNPPRKVKPVMADG